MDTRLQLANLSLAPLGFCYPNTMKYTASPILSLPHEVAEIIALSVAKQGFPTAIAFLAQTCRSFRNLIYRPSDTHLWREIFLTTFDDPRKLYFASKPEFDWGLEFQQRILAESYFKHAIRPVNFTAESVRVRVRRHTSVWYQSAPLERSVQALSALLDVCETMAPCHPDFGPVMVGEDNDSTSGKIILWRPLAHIDTLGMASRAAPLFAMHTGGPSLNILWLESVLERGLPWSLIARLCGEERDPEWDQTLEAQLLAKLITYTGFIDFKAGGVDEDNVPISRDDQRTFSRYRAREVVYNMVYLDARRHWGPYLLVEQDDKSVSIDTKTGPHGSNDYHFEDEETEASGEYTPFAGTPQLNITDTNEAPYASQAAADMLQYNSPVPTPKQLSPDWAWLAAARIVLQANMEDPRMDRLDEFLCLDRWREQGWTRPDDNVRKLSPGCEVGAAWDWAGVEGVWRRCMCWINYSELNYCNMYGGFDDPILEEHVSYSPMRLRIVRFDPPIVPEYPHRPTIVFEGEAGGVDWIEYQDRSCDDVRNVRGTVSMIAGGYVRWQLSVMSAEFPDEDEVMSEAVQLGGVASEAGFIGMWSPARRLGGGDTLGPFWQWRVA